MTDIQKENISEKIIDTIKEANLSMRPKWYFIAIGALTVVGILLLSCLILFFISFIFFITNQDTIGFVPAFGLHGAIATIFALPWIIIVCSVAFVILLEFFLRQNSFAYRRPLIYSLALVIITSTLGGLVIAKTELHETIMQRMEKKPLPIANKLYNHYRETPPNNINWGRIINTTTEGFVLEHPRRPILTVIVTSETKITPRTRLIPGAIISVFGEQENGIIRAQGIRDLPPQRERKFKMK